MGSSYGEFVKYPRTPHLFGSKGTDDDKHMGEAESHRFLSDKSLIMEEKLDGTNVGIHFTTQRDMVLQCRGHLITEGMHPQYDLFKQWAAVKRPLLDEMNVPTVPVIHKGSLNRDRLVSLIGPSRFDSQFENPLTGQTDHLMEGLYLRTEANGVVTGRAKFVRFEFVEKVKQSEHWLHQAMTSNRL